MNNEFDRIVRTVCSPNCLGTCGVNAFVRDDRVVKIEPATFPDPGYERICLRGIAMATQRIDHADRLTRPLIRVGARGEGRWREVSWDEAYDYLADKLNDIASRHGWRANSWISMTGNYGFKAYTSSPRVANTLGGTSFTNAGLMSDWAGPAGLFPMFGEWAFGNDISEIGGARYLLSVGRNMADTAHSEMHFVFDAMEQGCKFVMIDPRFSRSAAKADEWVAPRPGTDTALAMGMINIVISEELFKKDYLLAYSNISFLVRSDTKALLRERDLLVGGGEAFMQWDDAVGAPVVTGSALVPQLSGHWQVIGADGRPIDCCTGFDASWDIWRNFTPEHASSICGVPVAQIRRLAIEYATTDPAWIWLGSGPQRYFHGHITFRAWATLATLCGNIGKAYAGVSVLDGGFFNLVKGAPPDWLMPGGKSGHTLPGTSMLDTIVLGEPWPIKSLWTASFGFATQSPYFKRFVDEALPLLDLFVVSEQVMTEAATMADVVLPVVSYYEDDWDLVGGGENWFMQLRRRAVSPRGESRSDFDIYKGLCERLGQGEHWQMDPEEACRQILASHPDPRINAIDWETLRRDGVARIAVERPYTPFRDMQFKTPSGRIELYQEQFADLGEATLVYKEPIEGAPTEKGMEHPFTLITYKHVHSTHSTHVILPYIWEVLPAPRLEISPQDAQALIIADGDRVEVYNERGRFIVRATVTAAVRPGTLAMPQGWWQRHFEAGHPSDLGHVPRNPVQNRVLFESNYPIWDIACSVRKISGNAPEEQGV